MGCPRRRRPPGRRRHPRGEAVGAPGGIEYYDQGMDALTCDESHQQCQQRAGGTPRVMGSHFGDVTSGRIVRGGLARIERGWISSPWARIARGGVDCVAPGSHCASRPRPRAVGAGGRDSEPPPEHPGYPTSPMRPIGVGVRGAHSIYRRVGCPNLLQRPGSGRNVGRETLIFRASSRGRSRPGAPLQQIRTRLALEPTPSASRVPPGPPRHAAAAQGAARRSPAAMIARPTATDPSSQAGHQDPGPVRSQ